MQSSLIIVAGVVAVIDYSVQYLTEKREIEEWERIYKSNWPQDPISREKFEKAFQVEYRYAMSSIKFYLDSDARKKDLIIPSYYWNMINDKIASDTKEVFKQSLTEYYS